MVIVNLSLCNLSLSLNSKGNIASVVPHHGTYVMHVMLPILLAMNIRVLTGTGSVIQQYFCVQQDRVPALAALSPRRSKCQRCALK